MKTLIIALISTLALGSVYLFSEKNSVEDINLEQQLAEKTADINTFLPNWIGELQPVIGNLNFFDLSVPGTHDTFTYDLSEIFADHANSIPTQLAWVLHNFISNLYTFGNFGKTQGQTQTLNIQQQLDNGIRYIDFRAVYSQDGVQSLTSSWYSLHFMQTEQKFAALAQQIRDWLDTHEKEIVTIQISYHGDSCNSSGTDYPGISTAQKQKCWNSFQEIFQDILYNHETQKPLNQLSINDLLEANTRVIAYVSQWEEFTDSSPYAVNGCEVTGYGGSFSVYNEEEALQNEVDFFKQMKEKRAESKANNHYMVKSMATSEDATTIFYDFVLRYASDITSDSQKYEDWATQECAQLNTSIPNSEYCPYILRDLSQWDNFYKQISLTIAREQDYSFPNAIYIDQVDSEGTIRTGTKVLDEASEFFGGQNPQDARFAYCSTIILANIKQVCDMQSPSAECQKYIDILQENIDKFPEYRWNDNKYGRQKYWPL